MKTVKIKGKALEKVTKLSLEYNLSITRIVEQVILEYTKDSMILTKKVSSSYIKDDKIELDDNKNEENLIENDEISLPYRHSATKNDNFWPEPKPEIEEKRIYEWAYSIDGPWEEMEVRSLAEANQRLKPGQILRCNGKVLIHK